ncbi:MAG: OprO/OprP family phosphate-selective porin [Candidatus Aminicenantes bacterium]|nr:OprO/OprP family phosphate-selective porin [Candidatus Aminicenantes bacterium]
MRRQKSNGPPSRMVLVVALTVAVLLVAAPRATAQEKTDAAAVTAGKALNLSGATQLLAASYKDAVDSFSVRRARFTLSGAILKNMRYRATVDMAKTPTLLDALVEVDALAGLSVRAGQFLVPFSLESLTSVSDLDTINRSQVVNTLSPGRDIGTQGRDVGAAAFGLASIIEYTIGVVNGSGINRADENDQKDLAGRVLARPLSGLTVGVSFYRGDQRAAAAETSIARNREGLELAFGRGPASLKAEYIHAKDGEASRSGWYLQGAWFVLENKVQAVVKVDSLDYDRVLVGDRKDVYTAGFTWFIAGRTKLQVNFESHRPESGSGLTSSHALLAQFQAAF